MNRKSTRSAASGEVTAIGGYWRQYEYSACQIYRLMQEGALVAISIADPLAGIFDDLVIHTQGKILATQVKTQRDAAYVSLATQLTDKLLRSMIEAWRNLERHYSPQTVRLRYIFPGLFSKSDYALANKATAGARHSSAFAHFLTHGEISSESIGQSNWSAFLASLPNACSVDATTFLRFLQAIELYDEQELHQNRISNFPPYDRARVEQIQALLPVLIQESSGGRRWSEDQLIDRLKWRSRASQSASHVFPLPAGVQENTATETALLTKLDTLTRGYIALIGPPGTGKSTLLQRSIASNHSYSVTRYLAFHPDHRHGLGRADSAEFLNDVIADLRRHGLTASAFSASEVASLRREFLAQLDLAQARYNQTGRKTVIVVDGLDHVPREENPTVSFLSELPSATSVPEGVIILLGSQHLDLPGLHPTIIQDVRREGRTIVIASLPRSAIYQMAKAAALPSFISIEALYDAGNGHPLTSHYLIQALKAANDKNDANNILSLRDGIWTSLSDVYERVWNKLGASASARSLLGLLARAEGSLSLDQLARASNEDTVEEILQIAGFILSRPSSQRIAIFHNSFRLYAVSQTALRFGTHSDDLERTFHRSLATLAHDAGQQDPQHWMELRYLSRAEDQAALLALATPDYFRRSLAAFRSASEIGTDLRLTFAAVAPTGDRVIFLNKLLIAKEVEYRLEAVRDLDRIELLSALDEDGQAFEQALENRSRKPGWRHVVDFLYRQGDADRARILFDANEPLDHLFADDGFDANTHLENVCDWIERAHRFRPVSALVEVIEGLRLVEYMEPEALSICQSRLRFHLALGLLRDGVLDIDDLDQQVIVTTKEKLCLLISIAELAQHREDPTAAVRFINQAIQSPELSAVDASWTRTLALLAVGAKALPQARTAASLLTIPHIDNMRSIEDNDNPASIADTVFLSEMLLLALPEQEKRQRRSGDSHIADAAQSRWRELGLVQAHAVRGEIAETVRRLRKILQFFANAKPQQHEAYRFTRDFESLAARIVSIASLLPSKDFRAIVTHVDDELGRSVNNLSTSRAFQFAFLKAVFEVDNDSASAKRRLDALDKAADVDRTPQDAIKRISEFAMALAYTGFVGEARQYASRMHEETFGYFMRAKREPQYQFWAWLFKHACKQAPETAATKAKQFAQFILGMDKTDGDETASRLIGDLIAGAALDPSAAAAIVTRLLNTGLASWAKVADAVLSAIATQQNELGPSTLCAWSSLVAPFYREASDQALHTGLAVTRHADTVVLNNLVMAIRTLTPQSSRSELLNIAAPFTGSIVAGVEDALASAEEEDRHIRRLSRGENESRETVSGNTNDVAPENLEALVAMGTGITSYGDGIDYGYARHAETLVGEANAAQIQTFLEQRPHLSNDTKVMVAASRRMLALGERETALSLFETAVHASQGGQWSTFLGGEKLEVQRLRVELDPVNGREQGFALLLQELANGQTFAGPLFLNMNTILGLIGDDLPFEQMWTEVEAHLREFREYRLASPVSDHPHVRTHVELLAFLVAFAFNVPVPELVRRARQTAIELCRIKPSVPFLSKLFDLLNPQPEGRREVAALCDKLKHTPELKPFIIERAKNDVFDPDFVVSNIASHILSHLEVPYNAAPRRPLPAVYNLLVPDDLRPSGTPLPQDDLWTEDPWTWTETLRNPLSLVERGCAIPSAMLRRRTATFMELEGRGAAFGPSKEREIAATLGRLDMGNEFRRPLPVAALRGFARVLQELDLADEIDRKMIPAVWPLIGAPALIGAPPDLTARPAGVMIPPLPFSLSGGLDGAEWLNTAHDDLVSFNIADAVILAERTEFRAFASRDSITSHRQCLPIPVTVDIDSDAIPRLASLDRPIPLYAESQSRLVSYISADIFGSLERDLLTLCPHIGERLGWRRERNAPFVWLGQDGSIMASTLRWVDGNRHLPDYTANWYYEGQHLVLSHVALRSLAALTGTLELQTIAKRSFASNFGRSHGSVSAARSFDVTSSNHD